MTQAVILNHAFKKTDDSFDPFIYTDILATYASQHDLPIFHFWTMEKHVILGMQDTRLDYLDEALDVIKDNDYISVVRNSGGLAVVADEGILNLSMILPQPKEKDMSIDNGYEQMANLLRKALEPYNVLVEAKEITDSYCPGDFDLSINGKKFAGIAQRRIKNSIAIMIYLSVDGQQDKRGEMIRFFYQAGLRNNFGEKGFPPVNPESMKNLTELTNTELTVDKFKDILISILMKEYNFNEDNTLHLDNFLSSEEFKQQYDVQYERMKKRNEHLIT